MIQVTCPDCNAKVGLTGDPPLTPYHDKVEIPSAMCVPCLLCYIELAKLEW